MSYVPTTWDESTTPLSPANLNKIEAGVKAANEAGTVVMTARATAPTGWLLCQGQNVSRTTYAALFAAIGTTYGVGDGTTTFGLPDLQARFPVGAGTGHALGATGGAQSVTLTTSQIPSHTHGAGSYAAGSAGSHTHTQQLTQGDTSTHNHLSTARAAAAPGNAPNMTVNSNNGEINNSGAHTHTVNGTSAATGSGSSHENRPPYVALNFMIRT